MLDEFSIPTHLIDRKVNRMKIISPSNSAVDFGKTLKPHEFISILRREVLDDFLRRRAESSGATLIQGIVTKKSLAVDVVIGADGGNSKVAKAIKAGDYTCVIAFQERIKLPEEKMKYYENLAEMYVGNDVSPDFYAWIFPKCDHVAVGTETVRSKKDIKMFQHGIRTRVEPKIHGGRVIEVEAHPIPKHPRPIRVRGRVALVRDMSRNVLVRGFILLRRVEECVGRQLLRHQEEGERMLSEDDLKREYLKKWDQKFLFTFRFLDLLQRVFYGSNAAREALVELCGDDYVQRMTFESYLYKKLADGNRWEDAKMVINTVGSLIRCDIVGRGTEILTNQFLHNCSVSGK